MSRGKPQVPSVLDFIRYSPRARDTLQKVRQFMKDEVYPVEKVGAATGHVTVT